MERKSINDMKEVKELEKKFKKDLSKLSISYCGACGITICSFKNKEYEEDNIFNIDEIDVYEIDIHPDNLESLLELVKDREIKPSICSSCYRYHYT